MRAFVIAVALGLTGTALLAPSKAQAHDPYSPYRGYYGNPYAGNGWHDARPHWHETYTPFGSYSWYGVGWHDFRPHDHLYTPYGTSSYSVTPWGYTESYAPRYRPYGWR